MNPDILQRHWAILVAGVLAVAILLFVVFRLYQDSSRGRLRARVRTLRKQERQARAAGRAVDKAATRLKRLRSRAESVKPRHIDEASGLLEDAHALKKIADDQVLIAGNQVRKIIIEDYPPKRHESMRRRFLATETEYRKPPTLQG